MHLVDQYMESRQSLQGSFSAVSKPNFASKYFDESSRRELYLVRAISRAAVFLERNNCMIVKSRELSLRRGRILLAENAGAVYVELQGFYSNLNYHLNEYFHPRAKMEYAILAQDLRL